MFNTDVKKKSNRHKNEMKWNGCNIENVSSFVDMNKWKIRTIYIRFFTWLQKFWWKLEHRMPSSHIMCYLALYQMCLPITLFAAKSLCHMSFRQNRLLYVHWHERVKFKCQIASKFNWMLKMNTTSSWNLLSVRRKIEREREKKMV